MVELSFFAHYVLFPSIVRVFLQVLGLESGTSMLDIFFPSGQTAYDDYIDLVGNLSPFLK
jgi:hypothetical protein